MMFNLIRLGHVSLPNGIAQRSLAKLNRGTLARRDVYQTDLDEPDTTELRRRLRPFVGELPGLRNEASLLIYKKVPLHDDDWPTVRYNKRDVAPAFVHVVLSGSCLLRVGKTAMTFERGDVFLMNPNVRHEVISTKLCASFCETVPATAALKLWQSKKN